MKKIFLSLVAFSLLGFGTAIQGQIAIPASGGNATGGGGSVSYSVGQIVYTTNTSATYGSVTQGVQQPFEISVVTSLKKDEEISLEMKIYPNPASDFLMLTIRNYEVENLRYQLYDINGNILLDNKIEGNECDISIQNYLPAIYFLKVIHGNKEMKTFKIIKNQ
jgi:hypothetical protein